MKIKIAILDSDKNYLNRIINVFNNRYNDKLEVFGFSTPQIAVEQINGSKIDVFLISEDFIECTSSITGKTVPLVMVNSKDVLEVQNFDVVCKYQKVDQIYKKILAVYSANTEYSFVKGAEGMGCVRVVFSAVAGGTGSTTAAIAYAMNLAKKNKKVIYIDMNMISNTSVFLSAEGSYSLSDVLYAIKSKKVNIGMKIESAIRKDASGIDYLNETATILDMFELEEEEALTIIDEIEKLGFYDYIVLDAQFSIKGLAHALMKKAGRVVWVSDGTPAVNVKVARAGQAVKILDGGGKDVIGPKLVLLYNQFSNKTGKILENLDVRNIGGIPKIQGASERQVVEHIRDLDVFDNMFEEI